ncbi:MAG: class I mannose-6-phosphate isomerase, partial [Muribaculaceae bacterium]|nr:class I mannose-6-phosphate isomerase [Muribaculaceae bacterium]
ADFPGRTVADRFPGAFPLLIQLMDARADLSVQVHPDDVLAAARHRSPGKTEMWYVVDALPGSYIYSGLCAPLSPAEYPAAAADGSIMERIAAHEAAPGQFYFIPAGTLHAIGAGTLIAEVQQTSDITYRVYDYNRTDAQGNKRELHTELAADAIDYRFPNPVHPTARRYDESTPAAVSCRYFNVDYLAQGECAVGGNPESFTIIMALGGEAELIGWEGEKTLLRCGTTCMLAAAAPAHTLKATGATLVITII